MSDDITLDQQAAVLLELMNIRPYDLARMIEKYPALQKSWESFIINYHICLTDKEL